MPKRESQALRSKAFVARLWMAVVGIVVAVMGGLFCVYLVVAYRKAAEMDAWVETPCTVVSSEIVERQFNEYSRVRHHLELRYGYTFEGERYLGDRVKRLEISNASRAPVEKWLRRYPPGEATLCYVNPEAPGEAVLTRDSKAALYSIWFPLLFVAGGLGIAAGAMRGRRERGQ